MAARWGAGDETLTACNMEFFPMDTLDETAGLSSGETLEALQSCLDPSILSIFEDTPTVETKGLDEESEATLLTALTEILDNVDDENLSPFDTLPDSDLLSGQKGREHSPLRRLLCLSRTPPEKDALCSTRPTSTGKSLPRIQADSLQRSDGEEEDDGSLTLSPARHDSSPDGDLLDWEGLALPLPVAFEQEEEGEDGVSVSLGELVRHMHPYCMAICVENDDGEQVLPEGGILLEVVDQGENGEPILAIPDMDLPVSLSLKEQPTESEQKPAGEAEEAASDISEHIVVDDDDVSVNEAPVKAAAPATPDVKDEMIVKRKKEEIKERSPTWRKKKKKSKEQPEPEPVEGRVLRSGAVKRAAQEVPREPEKRSAKEKKHKVPKVPLVSAPTPSSGKPKRLNLCQTQTEATTTKQLPETNARASPRPDAAAAAASKVSPEKSRPSGSPAAPSSQHPAETPPPQQLHPAPEKPGGSPAAPSAAAAAPQPSEGPVTTAPGQATPQMAPPTCEAPLPPVAAAAAPEPKAKALSLAEYRRLRQQKKPAPVERADGNSTKWPSLPELPKELPPIPCLPDPALALRDPRRPGPQAAKKEVELVKPAWQPKGPGAPPTPEALLVPPAYMVASSGKAPAPPAAPAPQPTPRPCPPKEPSAPAKDSPTRQQITAQPPAPAGHAPQLASVKPAELAKPRLQTTTGPMEPAAAAASPAPSAPPKTTAVPQKAPNVAGKPAASGAQLRPPSAAAPPPPDSPSRDAEPVVLETKDTPTTAAKAQRTKSPTQELIEAFTSEIGIEAADLTSLLEQFEETQAKEEQCVPEVSGRAAAVGNSSFESAPEKTVVDRVRANDRSSPAALTPPATPPHQMWKPLAPVALLGKGKAAEASSKSSPAKVIQIEARPLPPLRSRSKPAPAAAAAAVDPDLACLDHDYCLPSKGASAGEQGQRWNVKQQSFITIKPIKHPAPAPTPTPTPPPAAPALSVPPPTHPAVTAQTKDFPPAESVDHRPDAAERSSVLETPDASPDRQETDSAVKEGSPRGRPFGRAYRRHSASRTPSPASSPKERTGGRSRKRRSQHSPSSASSGSESDSHSSRSRSRSRFPSKKRYRPRHSESSSSSSSRSSSRSSPSPSRSTSPPRRRRYSYSSSRSGSWSRSRSRSGSPHRQAQWSRSRTLYSPSYRPSSSHSTKANVEEVKWRKEKAIEERRVVYVGRIRGTMTQKELKERFSLFGEIEECTLHFRDHGDNYGFVTYYDTQDAFTAIENGGKLRKPDELPFDLCFGGRRQFCQTGYSDLDSSREYDPLPVKGKYHALDFDTLLKQAQQNLKR